MGPTDLRKAAVLLMSLPQAQGAQLLNKLDPKQVEAVSIEIAKLGAITAEEQKQVIHDFANTSPNGLTGGVGGLDVAKELLESALGKGASATLDTVRQSVEAQPFGFLQKVHPQDLLTFINDEHPQTIALVLAHLASGQAAAIIAGLPPDRQLSVIHRIAVMGQTSPEILHEVEQGLEHRMASVMSQDVDNSGGVKPVAEILNVIDRSTEKALLESLAQEHAELVDDIRRLMFVFDDISKFSDRDIQTVLKNVDSSQWAMALKGATNELKERILNNMSKRAATMLNEEMGYLGAVRASAVAQVQQQIVDTIRRLEDAGEIVIHAGDAEEQFVQ
jgi:flagellar motor switch protein FliG